MGSESLEAQGQPEGVLKGQFLQPKASRREVDETGPSAGVGALSREWGGGGSAGHQMSVENI